MARRRLGKADLGCSGVLIGGIVGMGAIGAVVSFFEENPSAVFSLVVASAFVIIFFLARRNEKRKDAKVSELVDECLYYVEQMKKADTASSFVNLWKHLNDTMNEVQEFYGNNKKRNQNIDSINIIVDECKTNFQWWLRNAIDRQQKASKKRIKNDFRNSKTHRRDEYVSFCRDIQYVNEYFDDESREFASDAENAVFYATGLPIPRIDLFPDFDSNKSLLIEDTEEDTPLAQIQEADFMDGREFERWCADLLRKNGFKSVAVTQGSGDQGVDVLAEKDGIKYAIQCKCYSKDLGNTPIQEVHAGKDYYGCHVGAVMTNRYFTSGAIEAAKRTNTLLWDRNKIAEMIARQMQ